MNDDTKIAGLKKVKHWKTLKSELQVDVSNNIKWQEAYNDFLFKRIETRYFEPIEEISKIRRRQGKGFSIVAILCSLIEFFETLKKGYEYRHATRNYYDSAGQLVRSTLRFEANNTNIGKPLNNEELFVNFLTENPPFKEKFTVQHAQGFYKDVRCAILHQAETGSNWLIKDGKITDDILEFDQTDKILLKWNPLKESFLKYLEENYKPQLLNDQNTQNNFIFKWDKICNI